MNWTICLSHKTQLYNSYRRQNNWILKPEWYDLAPECVYDYNKPDLASDSRRNKSFFKRGIKYSEKINQQQQIMYKYFYGSSKWRIVISLWAIQAQNIYQNWIKDVQDKVGYKCTK